MVSYSISTIILLCLPLVALGKGNEWAVLVAVSPFDDLGYPIEASVCHTYQLVHAHGIPDERIIVMMIDDVAYNKGNPHKGKIFNNPNGPDVYKNVLKDYTGEDVTVENFLHILAGNESALSGVGSGKVLKSGPEDDVFIFMFDHGDYHTFYFPDKPLHSFELNSSLHRMHDNKKYNKHMDQMGIEDGNIKHDTTCDLHGIVFEWFNVSRCTTQCFCCCFIKSRPIFMCLLLCDTPKLRSQCLGGCFSTSFLEMSDRLGDLHQKTLWNQFELVKWDTLKSAENSQQSAQNIVMFGDQSMGSLPLAAFQGQKIVPKQFYPPVRMQNAVSLKDVKLYFLMRDYSEETDRHRKLQIAHEIMLFHQKEGQCSAILKSLVSILMADDFEKSKHILSGGNNQLKDLECHRNAVHAFYDTCLKPLQLVTNSGNYAVILANLCDAGIPDKIIAVAMHTVCSP